MCIRDRLCTEANYNDTMLMDHNMWETWLNNGVSGALLFDYSGSATRQAVPLIPPAEDPGGGIFSQKNRQMLQDLVPTARRQADGRVLVSVANRMPYRLDNLKLYLRQVGAVQLPTLAPGEAATVLLPLEYSPGLREPVVAKAEYITHAGLKHFALLTPVVEAAPTVQGGQK